MFNINSSTAINTIVINWRSVYIESFVIGNSSSSTLGEMGLTDQGNV